MTEQHADATSDDPRPARLTNRTDDDIRRNAEETSVPEDPLGTPGTTPTGTDPDNEPPVTAPGDPQPTGGPPDDAAEDTDVPTAVNEEPPG